MEHADYADKLSRMIQKKTVSEYFGKDLTAFLDFHELLKELFPKFFSLCETEVFDGSLLIRWKGKSAGKPILFMNHHDVVEADGNWTHEPFSGEIEDGKIWGRGALDTKGGLFCMLEAANQLCLENFTPENDIYFVSACTEECDSTGADKISRELERRNIRFAFSLDEGGLIVHDPIGGADGDFAMVAVAEKGCCSLKFTALSTGGHASRPSKNTPLVRLGKFMNEFERRSVFERYCPDPACEMFKRMNRKTKGFMKFALRHPYARRFILARLLPLFSDTAGAMMHTTLAFTMAKGSGSANALPNEAWVVGDMRYSHRQGFESSMAVIKKTADKYGIKVEVTDPPFDSGISDFKSEEFSLIEKAVEKFFPDVIAAPYVSTTASDNRFMNRVADNCFGFVPIKVSDSQLDSIHGIDENVDVSALAPAVEFYKYVMKEGSGNVR